MTLTAYASRTGTRRNLDALREHGWRLLVSATGCLRHEGFPYALDNGAWTAFQQGKPFDESRFVRALLKMGRESDWVVVPDIVSGGSSSLELSLSWLPRVLSEAPKAVLAVQDGFREEDVSSLLSPSVGVFVGGSTEWKEANISRWACLAGSRGSFCHVGRVNTVRRIRLCLEGGASSFDGTSASRFSCNVPRLDRARLGLT